MIIGPFFYARMPGIPAPAPVQPRHRKQKSRAHMPGFLLPAILATDLLALTAFGQPFENGLHIAIKIGCLRSQMIGTAQKFSCHLAGFGRNL